MVVAGTEAMPIAGEGFWAVVYAATRATNGDSVDYNYMQFLSVNKCHKVKLPLTATELLQWHCSDKIPSAPEKPNTKRLY
jgi:hypothetical protein